MAKYAGFCASAVDSDDVLGFLLVEMPNGWWLEAQHISSSPGFSEHDIKRHYDRREIATDDDTFEWHGLLTASATRTRFPAAPRPAAGAARACRVCGCTDDDCSACVERTGAPCSWAEPDLCTACVPADVVRG